MPKDKSLKNKRSYIKLIINPMIPNFKILVLFIGYYQTFFIKISSSVINKQNSLGKILGNDL